MFRRLVVLLLLATAAHAQPCPAPWDAAAGREFWHRSQGSRMIRSDWMDALRQADGTPFMADGLARFGYLPDPPGRPIGFEDHVDGTGQRWLGVTCAACHTRALTIAGRTCLIEGGPALADFQSFAADLRRAMEDVQRGQPGFDAFADTVLGSAATVATRSRLGAELARWQDEFVYWTGAIPTEPGELWGPGRMDAVAMIFNRLTGIDLPPDRAHASRVAAAAPVRYPFLWNAAKQDRTQWTRFADNSNAFLAKARNLGEVYGVFGAFGPRRVGNGPVDYITDNFADIPGLERLEQLVRSMPTPAWRDYWPEGTQGAIDESRVGHGGELFQANCGACHDKQVTQHVPQLAWRTGPPASMAADQTDTRAQDLIRTARGNTGILEGELLADGRILGPEAAGIDILTQAVMGSLVQFAITPTPGAPQLAPRTDQAARPFAAASDPLPYEARVLEGVWAAAPFLHNGSVPTLAALLEPSASRPASFLVGPRYDPATAGLAEDQPTGAFRLVTTGCEDVASGRSRCGHEYGTHLSPEDKRDLLEFLKGL